MKLEDFWTKVNKETVSGCWEWTGRLFKSGYGGLDLRLTDKIKGYRAHRISWLIVNGPIPENMEVCHKCDNKKCVNPEHLFLGTHTDNMRDCAAKCRGMHGSKHKDAKLDEADVKLIKMLIRFWNTNPHIAEWFGVTTQCIYEIRRGKTWKHIS